MKCFNGYVETNKIGSRCKFYFEVEDDASEEEIESSAREAMFEQVNWNFEEIQSND